MKGFIVIVILITIGFAFGLSTGLLLKAKITEGSCNICIGYRAGEELTDESFQFIFTIPEFCDVPVEYNGDTFRIVKSIAGIYEYRTTMTPQEYEAVVPVARRAGQNYRYLEEK